MVPKAATEFLRVSVKPADLWLVGEKLFGYERAMQSSLIRAQLDAMERQIGKSFTDDDDRTQYYASGNADGKVYAVGEYHVDRFTRGWDAFKYVPPPQPAGWADIEHGDSRGEEAVE